MLFSQIASFLDPLEASLFMSCKNKDLVVLSDSTSLPGLISARRWVPHRGAGSMPVRSICSNVFASFVSFVGLELDLGLWLIFLFYLSLSLSPSLSLSFSFFLSFTHSSPKYTRADEKLTCALIISLALTNCKIYVIETSNA